MKGLKCAIFAVAVAAATLGSRAADASTDAGWWERFDDAALSRLIEAGDANNYDVAQSLRRIEVARTAVNSARAGWMPTIGIDAGWSKSQSSNLMTNERGGRARVSTFNASATATWEIDLFGRTYESVKGADASYRASRAESEWTAIAVRAEIASTYIGLRLQQTELDIARSNCADQQRIVDMTQARLEAGLATGLEVSQAKVVLYSTQATIPVIENSISQSINALSVLTVLPAEEVAAMVDTKGSLPDYHQIVASTVAAETLRQRPDVEQAELQIEAAASSLGIAKKDYLPHLSISGSIGTEAHRFGDLMTNDSFTYSVAPTLSWTLFDGFTRKNAVVAAKERMEIAVENYKLTLLTAAQDADNAISSYKTAVMHIDLLQATVDESIKAYNLAVDLYRQGLTPFSNVVDAQIDVLQYQNALAEATADALNAVVAVYKALGGEME